MSQIEKRLQALERVKQRKAPSYLCAKDLAELEQKAAGLARPVKCYIGVCPDDWDEREPEHEPA